MSSAIWTDFERYGAPHAELELIRAFVNTRDVEKDEETLATPDALAAWLREHDFVVDRALGEGDLERALAFREALRGMLLANNDQPLDEATLEVLRTAAAESPLHVDVHASGRAVLASARPGVEQLVARLLATVAEAQAEGTWDRLKACPADDCQWAFYDQSRNRSRTWCSMEVCGNRSKTRSYRARKGASG